MPTNPSERRIHTDESGDVNSATPESRNPRSCPGSSIRCRRPLLVVPATVNPAVRVPPDGEPTRAWSLWSSPWLASRWCLGHPCHRPSDCFYCSTSPASSDSSTTVYPFFASHPRLAIAQYSVILTFTPFTMQLTSTLLSLALVGSAVSQFQGLPSCAVSLFLRLSRQNPHKMWPWPGAALMLTSLFCPDRLRRQVSRRRHRRLWHRPQVYLRQQRLHSRHLLLRGGYMQQE